MRKLLLALSACVLCAAPLKAQSATSLAGAPTPAAAEAAPVAAEAPKPSLYPTTDEVRQQVARAERQRAQGAKVVPSQDWLYIVAAIVVGVVIAAVVLN
jgi:cobalamin biosynthesis Mg chelatase CobN